ncbi:hypothetical protein [Treponema denticola]|uniref:hypothetical protein n=1 Tax=Treponema denticola TaxID=158 RepID=UPI0020A5BFB2|nr:hypothetical protein [Treponema denticola]UTC82683.1 hypothetical protein HGJ18_05485 [Treponema denticola]
MTKEPINTSSITLKYFYYPIVLENGEEYFFVVEKQSYNNSKYENLSYDSYYKDKVLYDSIIPLSVHIKNISFKEEPIVPNSTVIITSKTNYQYILNNNQFINHSTLKRIRDICNIFKNKKGLSELLVDIESEIDLILNEDKVDNKWKISVNFKNFNTLNPYIIIENGIPKFNFTVRYMAYDWLFISYYKVVADDFKWESHLLDFDREVLSRFIEESYTSVDIDKEDLSVLNNIANSKNALIRFYGKKYYSDEDIKDEEKNALKIMLKLFNFLKSN